jgi:hypothetical protein
MSMYFEMQMCSTVLERLQKNITAVQLPVVIKQIAGKSKTKHYYKVQTTGKLFASKKT